MSILTRCPHCQTRFRVTDEQLKMASGKVRCGHCMGVFNATEYQIDDTPPAPPAEPAPQKAPPTKAVEPPPEPEPQEPPKPKPATAAPDEDELLFADNPEEDSTDSGYAGNKKLFDNDELSDSFLSLDREDEPGFQDSDSVEHTEENIDESWAEEILQEDHKEKKAPETPEPKESAPRPSSQPRPRATPAPSETEQPLRAEPRMTVEPDDREAVQKPKAKPVAAQRFDHLRAEPIALDERPSRHWGKRIFWTLVLLALIGGAVAQVTWFQFDKLSRIPTLRPFYEMGCHWVGCKLPPLIDVSQIQSQQLLVRAKTDQPNVLVVDAIIVNQAPFGQPFPAIALTFSNLNNDVVAQRLFQPDEYLAGEAKGMKTMPPNTPVRISLSIKDPGRDAVNYNIAFFARSTAAQ
ncbi:DUF3426 domain-containing protein [Mangrovitalea sediminis]|uniref:DUF3426 domain-containing protein n=1 Tax=Mangrovitalea sediminis TaxID=1982043 RepID=UPI000BE54D04|nr:DUF3426 domain-containing protein [Mangrovitalea sediminis]